MLFRGRKWVQTSTSSLGSGRVPNTQLVLVKVANMQKACSPSSMNGLRTAVRTKYNSAPMRRNVSDIAITRTGKPIIRTQGGRQVTWASINWTLLILMVSDPQLEVYTGAPQQMIPGWSEIGHTVTVFGATGFLGRYIVNRLGMLYYDASQLRYWFLDSAERMHGHNSISRGDGQKTSEGCRRFGQSYIHGMQNQNYDEKASF